ncbi:SGNH/GDSL hydrolase family protein [Puniceicoccaceae bacterium]|nr:SGNH/GDSL hydrolase family protein [Puniceicoccaceae bacterium]
MLKRFVVVVEVFYVDRANLLFMFLAMSKSGTFKGVMAATVPRGTTQPQWPEPSMIHCIGDSHSTFFSGKEQIAVDDSPSRPMPFFRVHHIGPALAFNLMKEGAVTRGREAFLEILDDEVPANAWVMPVFGEIDCRAHIQIQAERQGKPIERIIESCVANYVQFIDEILAKGYFVIGYNVIPSAPYKCKYRLKKKSLCPTYASQKQRNRITQHFNDLLRIECDKRQLPFLENFDLLLDSLGRTERKFYMDRMHLSIRAMPMTLERLGAMFPRCDFSLPVSYQAEIECSMAEVNQHERTLKARMTKYWRWKYNSIKAVVHPKNLRTLFFRQ